MERIPSDSSGDFDRTDVVDAPETVGRGDLKPSHRDWWAELRNISFASKRAVLVLTLVALAALVAQTLLLDAVDRVSLAALRTLDTENNSSLPAVLIVCLALACLTAWSSLRKPPPGGAGALLGGSDEATWQTSMSFRGPFVSLSLLLGLCLVSWLAL